MVIEYTASFKNVRELFLELAKVAASPTLLPVLEAPVETAESYVSTFQITSHKLTDGSTALYFEVY